MQFPMQKKRKRCELAYMIRDFGLDVLEVEKLRRMKRHLIIFDALIQDDPDDDDLSAIYDGLLWRYLNLAYRHIPIIYPAIDRLPRNIAYFADVAPSCGILFRFRYGHLARLFVALQFPAQVRLSNGMHLMGEEVFLFSLCRLAYPSRLADLVRLFGRELTEWSRAFKYFLLWIEKHHGFRLTHYFKFWVPHFPRMAEAITQKMRYYGVQIGANVHQPVAMLLDDTVRECHRPGAGPANRRLPFFYENATEVQRAFYNGWLHCHAVSWQTIDSPFGMVVNMWGPGAGRHNDRWRLRESEINEKIAEAQVGNERQYGAYGDGAFTPKSHIFCKHSGEGYVLTLREQQENVAMPKIRISEEWDYKDTSKVFKFVDYTENSKVMAGGSNIALAYKVATLLKNLRVTLNGCQAIGYFQVIPPTLENYLSGLHD